MVHPDPFDYDVALSFAEGDRAAAGELARLLAERNLDVFFDEGNAAAPDLHGRKARYYLIFISRHFPLPSRAEVERSAREAKAAVLSLRLDDTDLPEMEKDSETLDLRRQSLEAVANRLAEKVMKAKGQPRPPSRSHDLRSGNVPRARNNDEP